MLMQMQNLGHKRKILAEQEVDLAESQKPRQRVSNADRKVFEKPESFCDMFLLAEEFPDTLQYKISR